MAPKHTSGKEVVTASKVVEAISTTIALTVERLITGKVSPFSEILSR